MGHGVSERLACPGTGLCIIYPLADSEVLLKVSPNRDPVDCSMIDHENTINIKSQCSQTWIIAASFNDYMTIVYIVLSTASKSRDSDSKL